MTWGSEPVTIVEIDQDYCGQVYGVSPCLAAIGATGTDKCFNTYRTCQYASAWTLTTKMLRFCQPILEIPLSWGAIPSVASVSIEPTRLNIGGAQQSSKSLGQRGKCSVTFVDHPDGDIAVDPYLSDRAYDPFGRSTFWAKWLARNVYYKNRKMRIYQGYLGQDISEMRVSHYIINKLTGPDSSGRVKIDGTDVLRLADDDKATAPVLSVGELVADITDTQTTFSLTGAIEADYSATGTVRIGDELMTYTGRVQSGVNVDFSGVTRGTDGSIAEPHSTGDRVQMCIRYTEQMPHDIVYDLLTNYSGVDASYIDYAAWDAEASVWLPQFSVTSLITQPTGVNELIGSLTQECMFYVWWDEAEQTIKLRAVRPSTEDPVHWTEDGHILTGSLAVSEDVNQRISRVWIYYLPHNWAEDLKKETAYRKVRLTIDAAAESPAEYNESKTRKILCRWIRSDGQAINLGARYIARYRDTPKLLSLKVDAEQRNVTTADVVTVTHSSMVDFYGTMIARDFQVLSRKETQSGEVVQYEMQEFEFQGQGFAFWMVDDAPIFELATEVDRRNGAWWGDVDGTMPDGSDGYYWQ